MKIVFMGTPHFAVPSLKILLDAGYDIVGVITAPDRHSGRGQKLSTSPIKDFALEHNLKVLQPEKLRNPEFLTELQSLEADLQVVVAFRMLPEVVWSMPSRGTFNLHASILPQYRGAAPINWAIINGESETGVSTFFIDHQIDTGNLLFTDQLDVGDEETAGELHDRIMELGANLVLRTAQAIERGVAEPKPQSAAEELKHAPKLFKDDCRIDWSADGKTIFNHIRGLSPYPAAWTMLGNAQLKIFKVEFAEQAAKGILPGSLQSDEKSYLKVGVENGSLNILELQLQGKRKMTTEEFLRGNREELNGSHLR